jgi:hypothetical protein
MEIKSVHICFEIADFKKAMAKAGYVPLFPAQEYPEVGPGFYAVTYCDRDNNVIEFNHRVPPPAGASVS